MADRLVVNPSVVVGAASALVVGPPRRRFTFSTTTALVRPWLKLWRTTPCSTPRGLRVKVLVGVTLSVFSPGFFVVSTIPFLLFGLLCWLWFIPIGQTSGSETTQKLGTCHESVAFATGKQGCMYHI